MLTGSSALYNGSISDRSRVTCIVIITRANAVCAALAGFQAHGQQLYGLYDMVRPVSEDLCGGT